MSAILNFWKNGVGLTHFTTAAIYIKPDFGKKIRHANFGPTPMNLLYVKDLRCQENPDEYLHELWNWFFFDSLSILFGAMVSTLGRRELIQLEHHRCWNFTIYTTTIFISCTYTNENFSGLVGKTHIFVKTMGELNVCSERHQTYLGPDHL